MNDFKTINDFTPDKFTPTKWDGADKKATFAKQFITFVQSDFAKSKFPKAFYVRLSMTFGHIAHYNQGGFYEEFFATTQDKVRFLRQTLQHPCYGDPAFTYSDVEKALQCWLRQSDVLGKYEQRLADETEVEEMAALARLTAKYSTQPENYPGTDMDNEVFDEFLQDAAMGIHYVWRDAHGRELTLAELQELNTLLDDFFQGKRE